MRRKSLADMPCPIARALDAVGEWWSLLILREAFFGVRRFDDFQAKLGIARNVLAARLKSLVATGLLEKRPLPDEGARRVEYRLTAKGKALRPVLLALAEWGNQWDPKGPIVALENDRTGSAITLAAINLDDGAQVDPRDVRIRYLGPANA